MTGSQQQSQQQVAQMLVDEHGQTFAEEAAITLRDKPAPLWQLLVLSLLLSARIDSGIAVKSAHELFTAGWRTPQRMRASTWQQRVDALGRGGYRRFDERTSTQLEDAAELLLERWGGDFRRLHDEADGEAAEAAGLLQEFTGIGPAGAAIFLREVQLVWTDLRRYVDLTADGARAVGLPSNGEKLAGLVRPADVHRLVAACVRVARDDSVAASVTSGS